MAAQDYKIKKRKAVKIEELPPKEIIEYKSLRYSRLYTSYVKKQANRNCVRCGHQEATFQAYFQVHKAQVVEKYCSECLDKWVSYPAIPN